MYMNPINFFKNFKLTRSTKLVLIVLASSWVSPVNAFSCRLKSTGQIVKPNGSFERTDVFVDIEPEIKVGQTFTIDLSKEIFCKNESLKHGERTVVLRSTTIPPSKPNISGRMQFYSRTYNMPLQSHSQEEYVGSYNVEMPWQTKFFLTPTREMSNGILFNSGELVLYVVMIKHVLNGYSEGMFFNVRAKNSVVTPTATCDVNPKTINVTMGSYPLDNADKDINLSIRCTRDRNVGFKLSGQTEPSTAIFSNSSAQSPAQGIGIQIVRGNRAITPNSLVNLGVIGTTPRTINLKARYALNGKPIKAGNVRSVIDMSFVYN